MSKKVRIALGFVLTGLFLYLAIRNVSWATVSESLVTANYLYVIPAALITLCGYIFRTLRWGKILAPSKSVAFPSLFSSLTVGFAANNVLPARIGEFVRAYDISRKEGISKSLSFATIVLERVFDGWTLITLMVFVLYFFPSAGKSSEVRIVEILSIAIFLAATLGLAAMILKEDLTIRAVKVFLRPVPASLATLISSMIDRFTMGLHALRNKKSIATIMGVSVLIWTCEATSYYLVIKAFGIGVGGLQAVCASAFLVVFVNLGIMLPSAPGYVGTFQFFAKMALSAFGVGGEVAFSVAIVAHAMQYLLITSLGLFYFLRDNVSLAKIEEELSDG